MVLMGSKKWVRALGDPWVGPELFEAVADSVGWPRPAR